MKESTKAWLAKADAWLEEHREEMLQELQAIARIPSVSDAKAGKPGAPFGPGCRAALDHALERGRFYGFDTEDLDGFAGRLTLGDPENAIGVFAHLDVVPVGDGWVYPPFGATWVPEEQVLVGRGVDDNKASVIMALSVMRMLREFGVPMKHGVSLFCGTSEETGMQDMAALKQAGYRFPRLSLVPDAGFPVNYGQKGALNGTISAPAGGNLISFEAGSVRNIVPDLAECLLDAEEKTVLSALERLPGELRERITAERADRGIRLTARGVSGHAAHPERCENAIHVLAETLNRAELLRGECQSAVRSLARLTADPFCESEGAAFSDELSGPTTLVYSVASLKEGRLYITLDCRYSITCPPEGLKQKLTACWQADGWRTEDLNMEPPFYIPKDDPVVETLQEVYRQITGREDPPYTMGGGTYSRAVPNAVSFGPGMPGMKNYAAFLPEGHGGAHGRDELLPWEKLKNCTRLYLAALTELDGIAE